MLVVATGEIVTRIDDRTTFGLGFDVLVSRAVKVGITASQDKYESNIDYYNRSVFRILGGLSISANFAAKGSCQNGFP